MIVNTNISYGYVSLLNTFFEANELYVKCQENIIDEHSHFTSLHYEDNTDTAYKITFMSIRHLGFENMLCDYLINCGVQSSRISVGKLAVKRDMAALDKMWDEHRKSQRFGRYS